MRYLLRAFTANDLVSRLDLLHRQMAYIDAHTTVFYSLHLAVLVLGLVLYKLHCEILTAQHVQ